MSTIYSCPSPSGASLEQSPITPTFASSATLSRNDSFSSAQSQLSTTNEASGGPGYSQWSSPEERLPTVTITEAQSNPYNSQTDNYSPITPAASTAFLSPAPDANSCASAMLSSSVTPTPKSSHFFFRSHCSAKPRSSQAEISKLRTESQVQTTRLDTATAVHAQVSKYAKEGSWLGYSINTPDDARREIYDLAKSKAQEDKAKVEGELTNALIAYSKVNGTHSRWSVPARHLWGEACRGFKEDPSVKSLVDGHFKEAESEVMERLRLSEAGQQVQQDF